MNNKIRFQCPSCGFRLRPSREANTFSDYQGTICGNCGHRVSDDDVRTLIRRITVERLKKALES
jgi:hypothetical protein